jgi:hypothetical protein
MAVLTLEKLKEDFDAFVEERHAYELRHQRVTDEIQSQQKINTVAIADLTLSTQGLVDAWSAANTFQKFVKWISGFTIVAAAIAWLSVKLNNLG